MAILPWMQGGFAGQTPPYMPMPGGLQGPLGQPLPMPGGAQGGLGAPMQGGGPLAPQPQQGGGFMERMNSLAGNPLFQMGMGLLGAGQDSSINAPQAAMQGLLSANQVQQQQAEQQLRQEQAEMTRQVFEQQQAERQRREAAGQQIRGLLESAEDLEIPKSFRDTVGVLAEIDPERAVQMLGTASGRLPGNDRTPMSVLEYQYYQGLSDKEKRDYLNVKRSMQFQTVEQAPTRIDPVTGQPIPLAADTLQDATAGEIGAAADMSLATAEAGRGRMMGPEGTFQAVPGTQAAIEEEAERRSRETYADVTMKAAQTVFEDIDRSFDLIDQYGRRAAGIGGVATGWLPETPANRLRDHIESVKGNIAIDSLLRIKQSGAGLGHVPQSQLDMLAGLMGRLDHKMNPSDLRYNLARLQELYADVVRSMAQEIGEVDDPLAVYEERIQRLGESGRGYQRAPAVGTEQDGYRFKGGDPADPNNWEPVR